MKCNGLDARDFILFIVSKDGRKKNLFKKSSHTAGICISSYTIVHSSGGASAASPILNQGLAALGPREFCPAPSTARPHRRAFTLVEMLVVVSIIGILSAAIVAEMRGTFEDALLRATSRQLAAAFSAASSRAIAVNRPYRIRIDKAAHRFFLQRSRRGSLEFYPVRDIPAASGALDPRISLNVLRPEAYPSQEAGEAALETGGSRGDLESRPQEDEVTFYPDGTAEARQIVLADRDGFRLALRIDPITSRVQIRKMESP